MWNDALAMAIFTVSFALTIVLWVIATGRATKSLRLFASGFTSVSFGYIFLIGQGSLPDALGIYLPNMLIVGAHVFLLWGFRSFYGLSRPLPRRFLVLMPLYCAFIVIAYRLGVPYKYRASQISLMIILIMAEGFFMLKSEVFRSSKRIARFSFLSILSAFLTFHAARIVLLMTIPGRNSLFMDQHLLTSATLLGTTVFMILWAGLVLMLDIERILSRLEHKAMQLERIALNDQLTGIQNRYALETFLDAEIDRQDRYLVPLSLIMLDLDDFKVLNDANGHDSGDKVLIAVANRIRSEIRTTDKVFRWGGEEFLIVLPHTNLDGATFLAEKLRGAVAAMDFDTLGKITASFGVTERFPGEARDDFFRRVDRAMYRAKTGGRNRVESIRTERTDGSQPVSVEWRREWESGIDETDREHKALVMRGNRLLNLAITNPDPKVMIKAMDSFLEYCQTHFETEEAMLERIRYPKVIEHREFHAKLLEEARIIRKELDQGIVNPSVLFHFLVDRIVVSHLLEADSDFYPYASGGTAPQSPQS